MTDIKTLEANLTRAIQAAAAAQSALNAARKAAGHWTTPQQFYTRAECHAEIDYARESERENSAAVVGIYRRMLDPNAPPGPFDHLTPGCFDNLGSPESKAQVRWMQTLAEADRIVREREREDATEATTSPARRGKTVVELAERRGTKK
jgi:hypothetical protein